VATLLSRGGRGSGESRVVPSTGYYESTPEQGYVEARRTRHASLVSAPCANSYTWKCIPRQFPTVVRQPYVLAHTKRGASNKYPYNAVLD
jgi:hypothetical protein